MLSKYLRQLYVRFLRPRIRTELGRQRAKLIWFVWGYGGLLTLRRFSLTERLHLLWRFLTVDWNVPHSHYPSEIKDIVRDLAARRAAPGEGMLEAGCYMGGSTAKFSILCKLLGYKLWVYDSFQGVEPMTEQQKQQSYDFSGEYAATEEVVTRTVACFGEPEVCTFVKGWFRETIARGNLPGSVRLAYIDCDLDTGTEEVLRGVLPVLAKDGLVFSQDYHLPSVRALLADPSLWARLRTPPPAVKRLGANLARMEFPVDRAARTP
jgi:O-methyltransferase